MTLKNLRRTFEKATGLPKLEDLAGMTDKIPDKEHLELYTKLFSSMPDKETMRELNRFLVNASKLGQTAPDLQTVTQLLCTLKELDFAEINEALGRLNELVKEGKKIGLGDILGQLAKGGE
jgi:hypothetical protein